MKLPALVDRRCNELGSQHAIGKDGSARHTLPSQRKRRVPSLDGDDCGFVDAGSFERAEVIMWPLRIPPQREVAASSNRRCEELPRACDV